MPVTLICFCPLAYMHQKPKKKKADCIPAESKETETKSKKIKNKKNGDLPTESSPVTKKSKIEMHIHCSTN